MDRKVVIGTSTKQSDQNYSTHEVDDADYAGLDTDKFDEILMAATGADREYTFPDPAVANNEDRILIIRNVGVGAYKVTLSPFGAEKIIVYSGNEAWELTSFELLQAGDWAQFKSDATNWVKINTPYWHKFDDPTVNWKVTKFTGWTADQFTPGGFEITFSEGPIGMIAVKDSIQQATTLTAVLYRKCDDANISNTPVASAEWSHLLMQANDSLIVAELWLSIDQKVQIAVNNVNCDISVAYPVEYYQ